MSSAAIKVEADGAVDMREGPHLRWVGGPGLRVGSPLDGGTMAAMESWAEMRERHLREERALFRAALEQAGWNLSAAARLLGMVTHTSLQSGLRRHPELDEERRSKVGG